VLSLGFREVVLRMAHGGVTYWWAQVAASSRSKCVKLFLRASLKPHVCHVHQDASVRLPQAAALSAGLS
jgi:GMP synthase-like glutamine amidotransferase